MPPKFQSSFIPKGPTASSIPVSAAIPQARPVRQYDIFAFVAKLIFALSILAAFGVVGYKWYLGYSIQKMGAELEAMRQEVAQSGTSDLIRLNDRIISTASLIQSHEVLSPFFAFLTSTTPQSVQFTDFSFADGKEGLRVTMKGAARSYAALGVEAEILNKTDKFKNPVFSEIHLDEKGNVTFTVTASLSPDLVSYDKTIVRAAQALLQPPQDVSVPGATSTATTTPRTATTTTATSSAKTATTTTQ